FFFSSRRRHTRCYRDWSSDVCSSDLGRPRHAVRRTDTLILFLILVFILPFLLFELLKNGDWLGRTPCLSPFFVPVHYGYRHGLRSEERRVGKESERWWSGCS